METYDRTIAETRESAARRLGDSGGIAFTPTELKTRLKALGLFGLIACCDQIVDKPWLHEVLAIEERERQKRGFERRMRDAHVGAAKPMVDFDWSWPKKIDRQAIEELFSLSFIKSGHNAVLVGPNGIGKTMILKNVAQHALSRGHTVRFTTASDMLAELAAQDSSSILDRRLRRYTTPQLLCIDEVGYLSCNSRYADLLFEVVTSRDRRLVRAAGRERPCRRPPRRGTCWSRLPALRLAFAPGATRAACAPTAGSWLARWAWGSSLLAPV